MQRLLLVPLRTPATCGEVTVDPSALVAPGVLLEAETGHHLVVGPGVCIGMGTILHAQGGDLHIGAGVNLGAGVLVIGQGVIGSQTCIGAASTLINPQIKAGQVLPANSLLIVELASPEPAASVAEVPSEAPTPATPPEPHPVTVESRPPLAQGPPIQPPPPPVSTPSNATVLHEPTLINNEIPKPPPGHVIGEVFLSQLRMTLFPHRDNLNHKNP